ncbi:MAG TPA: hypothetical protein VGL86_18200 [Polyangia bacterium]|jgi:Flp pilus assembly protein TadD
MITIAALALAATTYYAPAETQAMIADAGRAAAHGDWNAAAAEYRKLADHGLASADVLYNLGTAELRLDDAAGAGRDLERARAAGAHGTDLEDNLALARRRAGGPEESRWRALASEPRTIDAVLWGLASLWALALSLGCATHLRRLVALR